MLLSVSKMESLEIILIYINYLCKFKTIISKKSRIFLIFVSFFDKILDPKGLRVVEVMNVIP
jgi:hypothetical protein